MYGKTKTEVLVKWQGYNEKKDIDLEKAVSHVLNKYRQEIDQPLEAENSFFLGRYWRRVWRWGNK